MTLKWKLSQQESELLTAFIEQVKKNEPGVQVFELDLDRSNSQFLTYEVYVMLSFEPFLSSIHYVEVKKMSQLNTISRYDDQAAVDVHSKTSYLADLQAAEAKEQLTRADNQLFHLELITRYIRQPAESSAPGIHSIET
ncbi:uncharacterized protein KY384_004244 [Bacidia gigantensis]|uniref:uncharacterized protein n=1 Tax=Bacidia gigantensis TaxID=2732470 RepID=UPI001D04D8BF|nr:uncharacterized protein KY384_004244 [Bacidia gigantensis]KAG8530887.1 hypothetical protein KY384_004244 [Bacidia gigantensis]